MDIVHKHSSLVHHVPSSESFQAYLNPTSKLHLLLTGYKLDIYKMDIVHKHSNLVHHVPSSESFQAYLNRTSKLHVLLTGYKFA
jgi:hypothetical protein